MSDPGAEILDRITRFWDEYGRVTLIALGVAAVVGVVTFLYLRSRAADENQASARLAEATALFWQGEYARSAEIAHQVVEQYGGTHSGLDALRVQGDDAFWSGDFKAAIQSYRAYLAKRASGVIAESVHRSLAYALESDGKSLDAAREYEGLVGVFDRESSGEFLAAAARCYRAAGQPAEAVKQLERLVQDYGDTSYANEARQDLAELRGVPG